MDVFQIPAVALFIGMIASFAVVMMLILDKSLASDMIGDVALLKTSLPCSLLSL